MPIYEYKCRCGKITEKFHKVTRIPNKTRCPCGWQAKRIISGISIQADSVNDVKWLPSACQVLQKNGERPLQSRTEYKQYLKDHKLVSVG